MKQLKSSALLFDYLDHEMAWRIKEIHQFKLAVQNSSGKNEQAHIRAGVSMLYAHWEGFVKCAANAYINYLSHRANKNSEMRPCFVALGMKSKLGAASVSTKHEASVAVVSYLLDELDKPIQLPRSEAVSTESNLSSTVFVNIVGWIGIDPTPYSSRFPLIDTTLLHSRNRIAHGEYLDIGSDRFFELAKDILEMLRWFKTDIENAVVGSAFLKAS